MTAHEALAAAQARIDALAHLHFIAGALLPSDGADAIEVLSPSTGQRLGVAAEGTHADVDAAVAAARDALPGWSRLTPGARSAALLRFADVIDANAPLLSALEALNVGKSYYYAEYEIPFISDCFRFMAGAARTAQAPAPGQYVEGHLSYIRREPVGVVGAITPWNFPLLMAAWKIAPALAAGNTIVIKPSELTPFSTLVLADLAKGVLPAGVLNVVVGSGSTVGDAMSHHDGIDMMALTGSVRSGRLVAEGAASTIKRVHLELGGKAPVVVFPDADLESLVGTLIAAGFGNTGQDCGAATRVICHQEIRDQLIDALAGAAAELRSGDAAQGEAFELGPLISAAQRDRVAAMVERAKSEGARVVLGGSVPDGPGFFYPATILADVEFGSEMSCEEVFGPVISVETFATDHEALSKANAVDYGLAASVWTTDTARALRFTEDLNFGSTWVNTHLNFTNEMPWVGFGRSGYGRDNSTYALDDYTRTKHVMVPIGAPIDSPQ